MRATVAAAVAAMMVVSAAAAGVQLRGAGAPQSNICNLDWNYCPRDPGCVTYTMSVHNVVVRAPDFASVNAEDLKPNDRIVAMLYGETTITELPSHGSYRIYDLAGKNIGAGPLDGAFALNAPYFSLVVEFNVTAGAIGPSGSGYFEFGVDVFQEASGSDEGVCVEVSSKEYVAYEESKPDPAFEMYCKDEGDGHFEKQTVALTGTPIPAPSCQAPSCSLHWYYCPRDPGCITYAMSVETVEVDVADSKGLYPGDGVTLKVSGTTSLHSVTPYGSYRIYDLAGKNVAAGVLGDVLTLNNCSTQGCHFSVVVQFTITEGSFNAGWMEFGLDTFQEKSGADEAFCIEIANDAYVKYEETQPQPPPGFVTYCKDNGWGHFTNHTQAEVVQDVNCVLSTYRLPASA